MKKTHISMVAGKGGVGKTTCAAAAAVHHALGGETTLIISTDPTPSLSHIFEVEDRRKPARVMDRLYLAELGVEEIKQMWDRKFGREVYEVFSSLVAVGYAEFVDFITSVLPGIGDEFDEINKHGLTPDQLVINNVIEVSAGSSFLKAKAEQQKGYLELLFARYQGIKIVKLPLFPGEIKGIDRLKELERYLFLVE